MRRMENPYRARGMKSVGFRSYLQLSIIGVLIIGVIAFLYAWQASAHKNKFDYDKADLVQCKVPADDSPVVVFETSEGTFKAVLYKEEAPKCVDYYISLVKDGYFDGTYVYEIQNSVYFIGGSKSETGKETNDTNTEAIEREITPNLWPFRGALMSYGPKGGSLTKKNVMTGSRILFVNSVEFTDEFKAEMDSLGGNEKIINTFKRMGGIPNFSQQYTTFGQVYDGFDVYDKICGSDVDDSQTLKPSKKITFDKVYMSTYGENKKDEFFEAADSSSVNEASSDAETSSQADEISSSEE